MRYMVIWLPSVQDELALIWMRAADQSAVSTSANRIDHLLETDPELRGQPYDSDWIIAITPLTVIYQVIPDDRRVFVIQVWHD